MLIRVYIIFHLHGLKALRKLEICVMIFESDRRSGEFQPSNITCLIFSLSVNHLSNLIFFSWP